MTTNMYRVGGITFLFSMYLSPFSDNSDAFLCAIVSPFNKLSKCVYSEIVNLYKMKIIPNSIANVFIYSQIRYLVSFRQKQ